MSIQSKRIICSMRVGVGAMGAYGVWVARGNTASLTDGRAWAVALLLFLGGSVVLQVLAQIVFHIAAAIPTAITEGDPSSEGVSRALDSLMREDEREQAVARRSARAPSIGAGIGLVGMLAVLTLGGPIAWALHVLVGTCAVVALVEGAVQVYLLEHGVSYG